MVVFHGKLWEFLNPPRDLKIATRVSLGFNGPTWGIVVDITVVFAQPVVNGRKRPVNGLSWGYSPATKWDDPPSFFKIFFLRKSSMAIFQSWCEFLEIVHPLVNVYSLLWKISIVNW